MKKSIAYSKVESVTYTFTKLDILLALQKEYDIKVTDNYEFDLYEKHYSESGKMNNEEYAELIVNFKTNEEKK